MSAQQAADAAGISKARWSQVENGYEKKPDGLYYPVSASDGLLARMADAIGLSPARLEIEGRRADAAAVLREMERRDARGEPNHQASLIPQCIVEREVIDTPDLSEEVKRDFVLKHRARGHTKACGRFEPEAAGAIGALRKSAL